LQSFGYLPPVYLQEIILTEFKNYTLQRVLLDPALNCFVGRNGMGKTNLLDAVYFLCMGKSYFTATDRNVIREGMDFFRLEGHFVTDERTEQIVVKVQKGKRKILERNGKPYDRLSEHVGRFPVVIIAPDDTRLATEGSEERRRFLDNTICQTDADYLEALIVYNRVLKQRNGYLKQAAELGRFDTALLGIYDEQLLEPAQQIFEARKRFMESFQPVFSSYYQTLSKGAEPVAIGYRSQLASQTLSEMLQERQEKDRILQRTTGGIHRDDLIFEVHGRSLKQFASQGQLKTYVLALKLAQYDWIRDDRNQDPILLLDDIFDKLDLQRVEQLVRLLGDHQFGQVMITDTDAERTRKVLQAHTGSYQLLEVIDGRVHNPTQEEE
jgi:DNA replication and repair protein RecF